MKLIKVLSAVLVALVIWNVTLTNRSVDESLVVASLDAEVRNLQNQNTILRAKVASLGSLGSLRDKIEQAGFVTNPKVVALPEKSSVASR